MQWSLDKAETHVGTKQHADALRGALTRLVDITGTLWAAGDISVTLANSTLYLEAAGHVVMAWIWLEQLLAAADGDGDFYDGKRAAGSFFFTYELPKVGPLFDLLASLDTSTVDAVPSWF